MEVKIRESLDELIQDSINEASKLPVGSDERSHVIEEVTELHRLREAELTVDQEKSEINSKTKERWVNMGLQIGLTVGGWIATSLLVHKAYKFEETGIVKSPVTRSLIPKIFLRK